MWNCFEGFSKIHLFYIQFLQVVSPSGCSGTWRSTVDDPWMSPPRQPNRLPSHRFWPPQIPVTSQINNCNPEVRLCAWLVRHTRLTSHGASLSSVSVKEILHVWIWACSCFYTLLHLYDRCHVPVNPLLSVSEVKCVAHVQKSTCAESDHTNM